MRPDGNLLPPGLIVVASFVNLGKVEQTEAIRLKADPGSIPEALDIASQGAERLVNHGITSGDVLVITLTGVLAHEQTPAMNVRVLRANVDYGRLELRQEIFDALTDMLLEFIDAASKPKAPPAPALPTRSEMH